MPVLVEVQNISKEYRRRAQHVSVLHDFSVKIDTGEFLALMGPSGSGKTTLLNLLGGLDRPDAGTITIGGARIDQLTNRALARWRARHVGFIFQFYNLLPEISALANVELPLMLTDLSAAQRRKHAQTALEIVSLSDRASHRPAELSGGQQQRVAIARAMVTDPTLLICDEPTGDLDRSTAEEILGVLRELNAKHGKTIVMVTHDPRAAGFATRRLDLDKGSLHSPSVTHVAQHALRAAAQ